MKAEIQERQITRNFVGRVTVYDVYTGTPGRKSYLLRGVSLARARSLRAAWNDIHEDKAELQHENRT